MTENVAPQVLIVGAGPAGLTLAYFLRRHNVLFRIIDKDAGPTDGTRAPVLWQRTQEILAAVGLRDAWIAECDAFAEESLHFYDGAASRLSMVDTASPYEKPLLNTQAFTENTLVSCLSEAGVNLEFGLEAVSYNETPYSGEVTVKNSKGETEVITADWVIAAEGSKSVIRSAAGLDFEGERYSGFRIHVADVHAKWSYATPVGQGYFFIKEGAYLGGQRLPGHPDRFYFYILTHDKNPNDHSHAIDLDELQGLVRDITGDDQATLSDLRWGNVARYRHGFAGQFRKGRTILLGDTAQIVIPIYGQGMNYAIHSAWNLGWKLAYVVRGLAKADLLDTYNDERRSLGGELDKKVDQMFRIVTQPKPLQAEALGVLAPYVLSSGLVQETALRRFTEIGLSYKGVGLSKDQTAIGKLHGGDRVPAVWCKTLPDCVSFNLLSLFDGNLWTLLIVTSAKADSAAVKTEIEAARQLEFSYPDALKVRLLRGGPKRPSNEFISTLIDAEERFVVENQLPSLTVLLVRPDGYLARIQRSVNSEVNQFLAQWLLKA